MILRAVALTEVNKDGWPILEVYIDDELVFKGTEFATNKLIEKND